MNHIARTFALVLVILFACTAGLAACTPTNVAVLATTPEPTPTATPTATPTPSPSPPPTPVPTPEPTPTLTREEALSKLNITSKEMYSLAGLIIYECRLSDGKEVRFMVSSYFKVLDDGLFKIVHRNVLDNTAFATFTTNLRGISQYNMMEKVDIALLPEFLKGATITSTYGVCSIPSYYEALEMELPKSEYLDYISKHMMEETDTDVLTIQNLTSLDCANFLLDIVPYENMVWASDYIPGF